MKQNEGAHKGRPHRFRAIQLEGATLVVAPATHRSNAVALLPFPRRL